MAAQAPEENQNTNWKTKDMRERENQDESSWSKYLTESNATKERQVKTQWGCEWTWKSSWKANHFVQSDSWELMKNPSCQAGDFFTWNQIRKLAFDYSWKLVLKEISSVKLWPTVFASIKQQSLSPSRDSHVLQNLMKSSQTFPEMPFFLLLRI